MNPMNRGEKARVVIPQPLKDAAAKYHNNPQNGCVTFVLAQPGCGAELVARLLHHACMTRVTLGYDEFYYKRIIELSQCEPPSIVSEIDEEFKDGASTCYPFKTRLIDTEKRMIQYYLLNLLLGGSGGYGCVLMECVGYDNTLVEGMVSLIRDIQEKDIRRSQIIFLTRKTLPEDDLLKEQLQQFRNNYELEDKVLSIDNLYDDPLVFLLKFKPTRYPDVKILENLLTHYETV